MFGILLFFASLILLGTFILFRFFEETRGVRLFAQERSMADESALRLYRTLITGNLSAEYRVKVARFFRETLHRLVVLIVEGLRAVERPLTRLSYKMRMSTTSSPTKEVSSFLKTITRGPRGDSRKASVNQEK